ncbi:MAG TPA: antibiotic biosynthesis monooxygenase [Acidimicrobiales bacterium]|nr:antibiotic biosynthesis monooxygenase [Acidimicrobiales bacterium]
MSSNSHVVCIFRSQRTDHSDKEYEEWSERMDHLVRSAPGYIEHNSYRDEVSGNGVTISYFRSMPDLLAWKRNSEHLEAQALGRAAFYDHYEIEVAEIVRQYEWSLYE